MIIERKIQLDKMDFKSIKINYSEILDILELKNSKRNIKKLKFLLSL